MPSDAHDPQKRNERGTSPTTGPHHGHGFGGSGGVEETLEFFDFQASIYDVYQEACIPKYREMLTFLGGLLEMTLPTVTQPSIVDLGCGTGNLSLEILDRFPQAEILCVDGAKEMLAEAKNKLSRRSSANVRYVHGNLADSRWWEGVTTNTFDAAVSALVLEHLPFEQYRRLLAEVYGLLKPHGWFVTVEGYAGELALELISREMAQLEQRAVESDLLSASVVEQMKALSKDKESHFFAEMGDKREWWKEAGFSDVNFIWQYYCVAILVGRKPAT